MRGESLRDLYEEEFFHKMGFGIFIMTVKKLFLHDRFNIFKTCNSVGNYFGPDLALFN